MKRSIITAIALVAGTAFAVGAYAQSRHDEKPHGSGKPAASSSQQGPMTGMRHDERPHGQKKPAGKKGEPKKDESKLGTDDCCKK